MFGKKNEEKPVFNRPGRDELRIDVHNVLANYLSAIDAFELPKPFPADKSNAIGWWIDTMQETEKRTERPYCTSVNGSHDAVRWEWPYMVRVVTNLQRFLALPVEDRETVVKAREYGVYWRGEDMNMLRLIGKETKRMREMGVEAYRNEAKKLLRAL